jgi:hypothetical protein
MTNNVCVCIYIYIYILAQVEEEIGIDILQSSETLFISRYGKEITNDKMYIPRRTIKQRVVAVVVVRI